MTSFALLHWCGDHGRTGAAAITDTLERAGVARRCGGDTWVCLAGDKARQLSGAFLIGDVVETRGDMIIAGAPAETHDPHGLARRFIASAWGRYVLVYDVNGSPQVMTDPSGSWPLWCVRAGGLTMVTDHVTPALARRAGIAPKIDVAALAATLLDPACVAHLGYVGGIAPLTPGRSYDLATGASVPLWNVAAHAERATPGAEITLRTAVDRAVAGMCRDDMVMQLSGGLDSAIVLAALSERGQRAHAVNFATSAAGGDERHYARLIAAHLGTTCTQVTATGFPDFRRIADAAPGAAPAVFGLDDAFEDAVDAVAVEYGATGVVTGQGGDAVFFQPPTPLVTVDRRRALGLTRSTWSAILDDARRSRHSIWHHVMPALRDLVRPAQVPVSPQSPHLLTVEARDAAAAIDQRHPWSRGIEQLPPGKRLQIVMIANSQIFHHRRASGTIPLCQPLLSQPVIEAALAIPTFELACGDTDRGLARRAFVDRLPRDLLARTSKGEASDHYSRAGLANLDFLRDFLLDGQLVALGITDRDMMSALLTRDGLFHSVDYGGLAMQVSCEAWARGWAG